MSLTLKADKGVELTHEELDANFTHLDTVSAKKAQDNNFTAKQTFNKGVVQKANVLNGGLADLDLGNYFTRTVSANLAVTVGNAPAAGLVGNFLLELTNGGAFTITWPTGTKWAGGATPTLTANGKDLLGFTTVDGGVTWLGTVLGKDYK